MMCLQIARHERSIRLGELSAVWGLPIVFVAFCVVFFAVGFALKE